MEDWTLITKPPSRATMSEKLTNGRWNFTNKEVPPGTIVPCEVTSGAAIQGGAISKDIFDALSIYLQEYLRPSALFVPSISSLPDSASSLNALMTDSIILSILSKIAGPCLTWGPSIWNKEHRPPIYSRSWPPRLWLLFAIGWVDQVDI